MTLSDVERLEQAARDATSAFRLDEAAFRAFYDRTSRALWAYLYRMTRSPERADELLQEAYYRLLRAESTGGDEAHRRNYLYRIATNLVRDDLRRTRGVQVALPAEDTADTLATDDRTAQGAAARADLDRAMAHLSARERDLLWLAYAEGSTHREIAARLGLAAGSIKLLLFRARRRLADILRRSGHARPAAGGGRR
jgi:RNA polymerase sigma-70 factor, ECF subfamily